MEHNNHRVMIVDDEEMVTTSISSFLMLETDYEVLAFQSPIDALEAIKSSPVDLVLSDFLMPVMDGIEFLAKVKEISPDTTLILLTGYADKENAIKAINDLALYQYIQKPWTNDDLKVVIKNGLERKNLTTVLREKIEELDILIHDRDKLAKSHKLLETELNMAREVQESMLPHRYPADSGLKFYSRYLPTLAVGGDFYDVLETEPGKVAVLISDVTGHGVQAALSTMILKMIFRNFEGRSVTPSEMLTEMNTQLVGVLPLNIYVAAFLLVVDAEKKEITYASAGNPHPILLKKKQGKLETLAVNGFPLGLLKDEKYYLSESKACHAEKGDIVFLYTDGLVEFKNSEEKFFSFNRVYTILQDNIHLGLGDLVEKVLLEAKIFSEGTTQPDDVNVVAVEFAE